MFQIEYLRLVERGRGFRCFTLGAVSLGCTISCRLDCEPGGWSLGQWGKYTTFSTILAVRVSSSFRWSFSASS